LELGAVLPIPTLPLLSRRTFSVPLVYNLIDPFVPGELNKRGSLPDESDSSHVPVPSLKNNPLLPSPAV
jgi:hypothetical protein